jgi:hypothetical protein
MNYPNHLDLKSKVSTIKEGFDLCKQEGLDDAALIEQIVVFSRIDVDMKDVINSIKTLEDSCKSLDENLSDIASKEELTKLIFTVAKEQINPEELLVKHLSSRELKGFLEDYYKEIKFPYTPREYKAVYREMLKESDLHYPKMAITRLGISDELANEMLKSWFSYDSFSETLYRQSSGSMKISEAFDESQIERIMDEQLRSFSSQLESLQNFEKQYGIENTQQVIEIFGIYNFNRHQAEKLMDQLERWRSGDAARTVVVEARSDWNSFTGKHPDFEEGVGEGVFYFEANSAYEIARVAVRIGQRERQLQREPDVQRFLVHAHGNPESMLIGVDGQEINTKQYIEASQKMQRISTAESNDYTRHLGPNFQIILQSCSTAADNNGQKNIAETISDFHDTQVSGFDVTISSIIIRNDGTVVLGDKVKDEQPVEAIIYDDGNKK